MEPATTPTTPAAIIEPISSLNLTKNEAQGYTIIFGCFSTVAAFVTLCILLLIYITSTRENMKISEKILLYNVFLADLVYEIIVLTIVTPSIKQNEWTFNEFKTSWIAFISTTCIFHSQLGLVFICDLIVLSLTDSYRFHASDNLRQMSALVISTLCISICICSLPSSEQEGYIFVSNWLAPSFNIKFQYGSIFMLAAIYSLILSKQGINLFKLTQVRNFFIANSTKITKRALKDMEQLILFTVCVTANSVIALPVFLLPGFSTKVTVILETVLFLCPVIRALLVYLICPHFHFGTAGSSEQYLDEFAIISTDDHDVHNIDSITEIGAKTHTSL